MRLHAALLVAAAAIGLTSGCGSSDELFPLEVGRHWSFMVQTGFPTFAEKMQVVRSISVGGAKGYEIEGPMGTSRLAWADGRLVAARTANAEFFPPITILRTGDPSKPLLWSGRIRTADGTVAEATAEQSQGEDTLTRPSRRIKTVCSVVTVTVGRRKIELQTWYEPGKGPIRQIQRTDGKLVISANGI